MYTDKMKRAFHSIPAPNNGFRCEVLDNDSFLVLWLDSESLLKQTGEEQRRSVEYAIKVKNALEQEGAVVQVIRSQIA